MQSRFCDQLTQPNGNTWKYHLQHARTNNEKQHHVLVIAHNLRGMGNKARAEADRINMSNINMASTNKGDKDKAEELRNNGRTHAKHDTQK